MTEPKRVAKPRGGPEVLRTEQIELVDSKGRVRIRLGVDESDSFDGMPTIQIFGPDESQCLLIRSLGSDECFMRLGLNAGDAYLSGGRGDASLGLSTGGFADAKHAVHVREGCAPWTEDHGPWIHFGGRPADAAQLERALSTAKRWIDKWEEERITTRPNAGAEATRARRHVRELCDEFGVEVPEWATEAFARRLRKATVAA